MAVCTAQKLIPIKLPRAARRSDTPSADAASRLRRSDLLDTRRLALLAQMAVRRYRGFFRFFSSLLFSSKISRRSSPSAQSRYVWLNSFLNLLTVPFRCSFARFLARHHRALGIRRAQILASQKRPFAFSSFRSVNLASKNNNLAALKRDLPPPPP